MIVMPDVALDPYSVYGHDGIIEKGYVVNDATVDALTRMSLSHAEAGADFVAPSDMMDGRVYAIRKALEENGHHNVGIMSYAAKYASAFTGRFAMRSIRHRWMRPIFLRTKNLPDGLREPNRSHPRSLRRCGRRRRYRYGQTRNCVFRHRARGKNAVNVPVSVYHVSGEYAMIKAAAERGWLDHDRIMIEQLMCIKRAGASIISTYFAKEASVFLNK
jgi:porphobilinogen synthase